MSGFKRLSSIVVVLALAFPLSVSAETRFRQRTALTPEAVVAATNRERAAYGLPPLQLNEKLTLAANDRVRDMFAKHYFEHVSPDGISPFSWVDRRGYRFREVAENLAVGYRTAYSVVDGWMHSAGHRKNILTRAFGDVGIAIADASPDAGYSGPLVVALYGGR